MTPMVDLGFLLLTFFVLTTTIGTPVVMPIAVPAKTEDLPPDQRPEPIAESKVLFLLVSGKDRVYYYKNKKKADGPVQLESTVYGGKGLRKVLVEKMKDPVLDKFKTPEDQSPLIVMIKMTSDATYANMVDVLDEMTIVDQKKYMLLDADPREIEMIADYEKSQSLDISVEKSLKATKR